MYKFLKEAHSGLAYLVILTLITSVIYYFLQFFNKKSLNPKTKTLALITMILVHIQVLLGIIVYFISPLIQSGLKDFGSAMSDSLTRLQVLEHPLTMLIAAVLVTIAHKQIKTKSIAMAPINVGAPLMFLLSLLLVLSRIPWSVWLG